VFFTYIDYISYLAGLNYIVKSCRGTFAWSALRQKCQSSLARLSLQNIFVWTAVLCRICNFKFGSKITIYR